MNYSWNIVNATIRDTESLNKVVVNCVWKKTGEDADGNIGIYYGNTQFSLDTLDPDTFIDFDSLTEETMLTWIQSRISEEVDSQINECILMDLEKKKYPEVTVAFPWQN